MDNKLGTKAETLKLLDEQLRKECEKLLGKRKEVIKCGKNV